MIFSHKIIIHFVSGVKGGESKKNKIKDETEGNENEMFGEYFRNLIVILEFNLNL